MRRGVDSEFCFGYSTRTQLPTFHHCLRFTAAFTRLETSIDKQVLDREYVVAATDRGGSLLHKPPCGSAWRQGER